jgi:hypothetical protein
MNKTKRTILNIWLIVHAVITLAAGVVLIATPGIIPSTAGIDLPGNAVLLAYFLGAAEIAIAFLSFGASKIREIQALMLIIWTFIIFHAATAAVELYDIALHGSNSVLWANIAVHIAVVVFFFYLKLTLRR